MFWLRYATVKKQCSQNQETIENCLLMALSNRPSALINTAKWRLSKSHHKSKCEGCERDGAVPNMCSRLKVSQVYSTRWANFSLPRSKCWGFTQLWMLRCESNLQLKKWGNNSDINGAFLILQGFLQFLHPWLWCRNLYCSHEACRIYCTTGRYLELLKIWLQSVLYLAVYVAFRKHCQPQ